MRVLRSQDRRTFEDLIDFELSLLLICLVDGNLLLDLFDLIGQVPKDCRFGIGILLVPPAVPQIL